MTLVLTDAGRAQWLHDRAESCLPGLRSQIRRTYQYLHEHPALTARGMRVYLGASSLRAGQVVQVMLSLGLVEVDAEDNGSVSVIRLAPERRLWSGRSGVLDLV